ncbi:hypothetical protein F7R91_37490 [Streptomyces luteolifulvus]|uniref:Lipoprotein n=1 Tax=Streptomyces luteolifulvus TaxID=2615112 RepID=A0A6H9UP38_9ACTN|nr:hypothetical protein F7R91_37490 [Streptomyces luteolifulvus]
MNAAQVRRGALVAVAGVLAVVVGAVGYRWLHDRATPHGEASPVPGALDLRAVDWPSSTIPGSLCRSPTPIRLHGGTATNVPSAFDGPEENMPQDVAAYTEKITYGDVTGDGNDEAALPVLCANHDSTAAGQRAMGIMLFDGTHGRMELLGTLTSRQPRGGEPPNFLEIKQMSPGKITVEDRYYRQGDANCCPSGHTTQTWTYHSGRLTADAPAAE